MKRRKVITITIIGIVFYLVIGALFPYFVMPKVSEETKEITSQMFLRDNRSDERAMVIENNGDALKERIRLIANAKDSIVLSTYEFRSDESGKDVLSALIDASQRGVEVKVLVDGVAGLIRLSGNEYFMALSSLDRAEIKIYNPITLIEPWKLNGRLHDKYLLVDEKTYILGGRNNYDYFLGNHNGYKNYDWDMLIYSDDVSDHNSSKQLSDYFGDIWDLSLCHLYKDDSSLQDRTSVKDAREELQQRYQTIKTEKPDWFENIEYENCTLPTNNVKLIYNPTHCYDKEPIVYYQMTELMKTAQHEVKFHTPYIIGNDWMVSQIQDICQNVPSVTMMTNSVANNGNPFGAMDYQKYKDKLIDTGLNILEYDGGVSYHGKCFTIDDHISAIGSFNWDMRSTYIDTEMMVVVDSQEVNEDLKKKMEVYEQDALKVKDEKTYDLKENQVPQEMSFARKTQLFLMQIFVGWLRFLM